MSYRRHKDDRPVATVGVVQHGLSVHRFCCHDTESSSLLVDGKTRDRRSPPLAGDELGGLADQYRGTGNPAPPAHPANR